MGRVLKIDYVAKSELNNVHQTTVIVMLGEYTMAWEASVKSGYDGEDDVCALLCPS